ncbi:hypothetical protein RND81_04G193100 [Saponaria officinalis]|uniref:Uncharacterized protein n=1 Tax=Saponaria officinalis TaxID=3572 RepID=A0AAW1LMZ3_SAPOF
MKILNWIQLLLLVLVLYGAVCRTFITRDVLESSQVTHNNIDQLISNRFRKLGEVPVIVRRAGPVPVPSPPLWSQPHVWMIAPPPPSLPQPPALTPTPLN